MDIKLQQGLDYIAQLEEWRGDASAHSTEKISRVLRYLGDPQDRIPTIHVAGTNGKGSVSAACASVLAQTGARVGLFVSPHLIRLNERIVIEGLPVSDLLLAARALELKAICEKLSIQLTFFEGMLALLYLIASDSKLDWVVLEVGLGGRLDATNIVSRPQVSIITSIDFDHMDILGDTLAKIAFEKAGIIKQKGVVLAGYMENEALEVIESVAKRQAATLYSFGRDFGFEDVDSVSRARFWSKRPAEKSTSFTISLQGPHQFHNMTLALQAASLLGIPDSLATRAVSNFFFPARLEMGKLRGKELLIDCAHNPHGVTALGKSLEILNFTPETIVFGALGTKNWPQMIDIIGKNDKRWALLSPRSIMAAPLNLITNYLSCKGISHKVFGSNYWELLDFLEEESCPGPILVFGSMYMIGGMRELFLRRGWLAEKPMWTRLAH